jgi:hypothetical protein
MLLTVHSAVPLVYHRSRRAVIKHMEDTKTAAAAAAAVALQVVAIVGQLLGSAK